ncbi:type II toxin-antitoxin system CcdA family antitoxin [Enterobacter hormaechei]|uniref:type II toxin-antitoxin system CcdA family antitoxin n=1 Tax=Enterobacter cloacae complex TaxID=354276 RepID=UPI00066976DF|nr:type II toxin-antitoxin system CcdA family antitoxin [Enterobacter hormaechei]QJP75157.1 type II toxin-antitoxin system CcdA family antitoxin [Enterobacter cloacae]ELY2038084.1 type II toxin-antitoxin system CcdA family antitoxin [Enterobacter hormaechei]MCA2130549.1 type II toxin-antitoxin system CcdA family antitoxin [Enterobacter hormaechei]MCE1504108.1 type II toxin-antitoxin system CcdA family antitoxin [Enterobacter hormaechei]MDV5526223.1 type II toxin-antitoxin system CcdA family an
MLIYYATLRQFMRIPMGVPIRGANSIKKSVNVSLSPDILEEARRLKLNLSAVLTAALQEQFREHRRAEWLEENKASIDAINQWVDENGSFSDFQRSF